MSAPARYRIVHLAQTTKQASVPIVPQRRPAAFAWALVAAGIAIWATALGSAIALFPSSAPVAAAVAAPAVPAGPEPAAPGPPHHGSVAPLPSPANACPASAP